MEYGKLTGAGLVVRGPKTRTGTEDVLGAEATASGRRENENSYYKPQIK